MRVLLGVAVAAGTLASAAAADTPAGFLSQPRLASRAVYITHKPVTVVCAQTEAAWSAEEAGRPSATGDNSAHVDADGGTTIYLSPDVCRPLMAKVRGRAYDTFTLGVALEIFAHEAEHIAGSTDEGATECAALAVLPKLARAEFGVRQARTLATIEAGARAQHEHAVNESGVYQGNC